jgi:Flp pilus assembly protein TadG
VGPVGGEFYAGVGGGCGGQRGRTPHGKTRGQSLVEFALVVPLFIVLVFAVVEYSLINASIGAYNFAAKDAARYGAIKGPTDANADCEMLDNFVTPHVAGVVAAVPIEVDIFEATESGVYSTTALQDKYSPNPGTCANWNLISGNWQPGTACPTPSCRDDRLVSQDYLGVHITYQYTYVTAFFSSLGATITLTADSVQRIEPQELFHRPAPGVTPILAARSPTTPFSSPDAPFGAALGLLAIAPACLYRPSRRDSEARRARGLFGPLARRFGSQGKERRS